MIEKDIKIPTLNTVSHEWSYNNFCKEEFKELLQDNIKIPGTYNFDKKVENFYTEASTFKDKGFYYNRPKGTKDYKTYWDRQKELSMHGMIVDGIHLQSDHYFYLNFLPINIKATQSGELNVLTLPDFRDLDFRTYNKDYLNELNFLHSIILKGRQLGYEQPYTTKVYNSDGEMFFGSLKVGNEITLPVLSLIR